MAIPISASALHSFLGLCSHYYQFVPGFPSIAAPLHCLTENSIAFVWTSECDFPFQWLKQVLCQAPVLACPTSEGTFVLNNDASNTGIRAVLSQKQGKEEKVFAHFSHSLTKSEQQYCEKKRIADPSNSCHAFPPLCLQETFQSVDRPWCTKADHKVDQDP